MEYETSLEIAFFDALKDAGLVELFEELEKSDDPDIDQLLEVFGVVYESVVLDVEYKKMVREKFYKMLGVDISYFTENALCTFVPPTYHTGTPPDAVAFLHILNRVDLRDYNTLLCNVYSLSTDSVRTVRIADLIPFDLKRHQDELKKWKIVECRATLDKLGAA